MGKSSKIPGITYTFMEHYSYLSKWFDSVDLPQKVNLVVHDWGSGLGFHWANEHQDRIRSITHMKSLIGARTWAEMPDNARPFLQTLRTPAGEDLILKKNLFISQALGTGILRKLTDEEMALYEEPYKNEGEDRRPTLTWPREIPIIEDGKIGICNVCFLQNFVGGRSVSITYLTMSILVLLFQITWHIYYKKFFTGPENVVKLAQNYSKYLETSKAIPKLHIKADPGALSATIPDKINRIANQREVTVQGLHFIQEDSPDEIGKAIRSFLEKDVFLLNRENKPKRLKPNRRDWF
ncbi:coelenterazine h 2-monooxygenase-like [Ciona intestinalis]